MAVEVSKEPEGVGNKGVIDAVQHFFTCLYVVSQPP
jgi:hypothetical protein